MRGSVVRLLLPAAAFGGLWALLAAINPTTTYRLAPLLVPLVPLGMTLQERSVSTPVVRTSTLAPGAISLALAGGLSAAGWLSGPSLLPSGGAALEAIVFSAVAIVLGVGVGSARMVRQ
jgi:hypothetical protein